MAKIEIYLEPNSELRALFNEIEWDNRGFLLATIHGALPDVKLATAVLAATSDPQEATINSFSIRQGSEGSQEVAFLFIYLSDVFPRLSSRLKELLTAEARESFDFEAGANPMLLVAELPIGADAYIPAAILTYLNEPISFDRLTVETEEDVFHYSL